MAQLHPTILIGPYLERMKSPLLVTRLISVTECIGEALSKFQDLSLEKYELNPSLDGELSLWPLVNAQVNECLAAAQHAASETLRCFPSEHSTSEDLMDLELDLALDDLHHELPAPILDSHEQRMDEILEQIEGGNITSVFQCLAEAAHSLDAIVMEHLGRLESAPLIEDNLALMGELNEMVFRTSVTLNTMVAIIIRGLTTAPLQRAFPDFTSGLHRALRLRGWVADLRIELKHILAKVQQPNNLYIEEVIDYLHQVANIAAIKPEFRWLRSHDRQQLQSFRRWAHVSDSYTKKDFLRQLHVLDQWIQQMSRINNRNFLIQHDRESVDLATSLLNQSIVGPPVLTAINKLYGRSPELDQLIRQIRAQKTPNYEQIETCLRGIERDLEPKDEPDTTN